MAAYAVANPEQAQHLPEGQLSQSCPDALAGMEASPCAVAQPPGELLVEGQVAAPGSTQVAMSTLAAAAADGVLNLDLARKAGFVAAPADRPDQLDLRCDWWPVSNLAWQHGSAVAAVVGGVLRYGLVRAGRLNQDNPLSLHFTQALAQQVGASNPQVLVNPALSLLSVLETVRRYGSVSRNLFDQVVQSGCADGNALLLARAAELRAHTVVTLERDPEEWRVWMAEVGPVLCRVTVDANWRDHRPGDAPLHSRRPREPATEACAMVGYTRDGVLFRREYGSACGDNGCVRASDTWAVDSVTEAWGLVV